MYVMQTERRTSLKNSDYRSSLYARVAFLSLLIAAVDQISKYFALNNVGNQSISVIGNFLKFHIVRNTGSAFGQFSTLAAALSAFAIAFLFLTVYLLTRLDVSAMNASQTKANNFKWGYIAGFVLGGLMGNLCDRIFRYPQKLQGSVVDWIELPHWPIFNLADVAIVIAALLALFFTRRGIDPKIVR